MGQKMLPVPRWGVRLALLPSSGRRGRGGARGRGDGEEAKSLRLLRTQAPPVAFGDRPPSRRVSKKKKPWWGFFSKRSPRRKELKAQSAIATRNDYAAGQVSKKRPVVAFVLNS